MSGEHKPKHLPVADRLKPPETKASDPLSINRAILWASRKVAEGVMSGRTGDVVIRGYKAAMQYAIRCEEHQELKQMSELVKQLEEVRAYIDKHGAH